jgi:hypothetical protein
MRPKARIIASAIIPDRPEISRELYEAPAYFAVLCGGQPFNYCLKDSLKPLGPKYLRNVFSNSGSAFLLARKLSFFFPKLKFEVAAMTMTGAVIIRDEAP